MGHTIRWKRHPLRDEPISKSLLLGAVIFAVCVAAYLSFGHPVYSLITFSILVCSLSRYFLPTWITLTDTSVHTSSALSGVQARPWNSCTRVVVRKDGLYLSHGRKCFGRGSPKEHYIPLRHNGKEVAAFIERVVLNGKKTDSPPLTLVVEVEGEENVRKGAS
jgi:hypothetical protein